MDIYFILFYFILFYFILFYFTLFYFILLYFILLHFILFSFILFYFILFYFILFYFILFYLLIIDHFFHESKDTSFWEISALSAIIWKSRTHFKKIGGKYLKNKSKGHETNRKNTNIISLHTGINRYKYGLLLGIKCRIRYVICFANPHNPLNWWKNYWAKLLNIFVFNNVRQPEIHSAEPVILKPTACEIEMALNSKKKKNRNQ